MVPWRLNQTLGKRADVKSPSKRSGGETEKGDWIYQLRAPERQRKASPKGIEG